MLATNFVEHGYDLKQSLRFIANSAAYQSQCEMLSVDSETRAYQFQGPRAKRMTAEQFTDSVWQLTDAAPAKMDATFLRGKVSPDVSKSMTLTAQWIWSSDGRTIPHAAGEKRSFRKRFDLQKGFGQAGAVVTCDNKFTLFIDKPIPFSDTNFCQPA